jgi:hypothetical protein
VGLAAATVPAIVLQSCNTNYESSLAVPGQLTFIMDTETIIKAGKQYQLQFPKENSERKLVKLLKKDIPDGNETAVILEQKIIEDYKADNTVLLDGWILSVTEARQCALFSITQSN